MMDYWPMHSWGVGVGPLGFLLPLLFWIFIIWAIVVFIRSTQTNSTGMKQETKETPLDILKARYAKGEIDKKEFEEKKKDLS